MATLAEIMQKTRQAINAPKLAAQQIQAVQGSPEAITAIQQRAAAGDKQAQSTLNAITTKSLQEQTAQYTHAVQGGIANKVAADPLYGLSDAERQQYAAGQQLQQKYGSDFSWLDPTFQYTPALLGQSAGSQVYTDPALQQAQYGLAGQLQNLAGQQLNFQSPDQQNAYLNQLNQIAGGARAPQFTGSGLQHTYLNLLNSVNAPSFAGSDAQQQQALQNLYGMQMPSFAGQGAQQQEAYERLAGIAAPQFDPADKARQQSAYDQAMSLSTNTGPNALKFDDGSRQLEQYGNLKDIIAGGGATEIERNARLQQQAEEESWLRGQREADLQDFAERGLTGSGQELLALSADRQASAGRNMLRGTQTAADLEKRKLDAIGAASGLATDMRGNTISEQALLNQARTTGLGFASDIANNMRNQTLQEQLGLNNALQSQARGMGDIASAIRNANLGEQSLLTNAQLQKLGMISDLTTDMRGQSFNEAQLQTNTQLQKYIAALEGAGNIRQQDNAAAQYLDERMINAINKGADISTTMRNQQYQEQIGQRNATQQAYDSLGSLLNQTRTSQAQEGQFRADAADQFARYNQDAINTASSQNVQFLQNAYSDLMTRQHQRALEQQRLNAQVAQGLMGFDQAENQTAYNGAKQVGLFDTSTFNNSLSNYNQDVLGLYNQNAGNTGAVNRQANTILPQAGQFAGQAFENFIMAGAGGAGGKAGGASGGFNWGQLQNIPQTNLQQPQLGQSSPYQGSSNYGVGLTGNTLPQNYGTNLGGWGYKLQY